MELRDYQKRAVAAGMQSDNGVLVLPTGSGKSLIGAGLVQQDPDGGGILVLQPSVEILDTNVEKARELGIDAKVYSASANTKQIGQVTYATIGSIIKQLRKFSHCNTVLIDECHLVNAKGGMYDTLIRELKPARLLGMTATPYRLASNSMGSFMRIITRTRPKLFDAILHVTNPRDLVEQGYLVEPEVITVDSDTSMLKLNSTGAEFTERSILAHAQHNDLPSQIVDLVPKIDRQHILVFVESVADSQSIVERLNANGMTAAEINAKTDKAVRARRLKDFRNGEIRAMVNVGTLTTGYDFPALDCIVDGRPTMSASLHYQKTGRVVRPSPGKTAVVYDLSGNIDRLGNPLNYTMALNATGNNYELYSEKGRITTRNIADGPEADQALWFGKYKGRKLCEVEDDYLEWAVREMKGEKKHMFYAEIQRREIAQALAA